MMLHTSIEIRTNSTEHLYGIAFPENFEALTLGLEKEIGDKDFLVITDENVFEKTKFKWLKQCEAQGNLLILPPGEDQKNWGSIQKILDKAFENKLDRKSLFVAVSGGVIGDMTGFAASIFMRGIPFVQVPTTLLAMVDSSVGGKTGIDCPQGKNLIGAFQQPQAVFCVSQFCETLSEVEIRNGLAEMVKHGILGDKTHFEDLFEISKKTDHKTLHELLFEITELIPNSINIKKQIVELDEKEQGVRMYLNLGHTFGHAIELLSSYEIPHGQAVAIGTVMAAQYAQQKNLCDAVTTKLIQEIFENLKLDLTNSYSKDDIFRAMRTDKKKNKNEITLILPKKIGEVTPYVTDLS